MFLVRIDSCQHRDNLKTYGSCTKAQQMRGICPRCGLIRNDTAELQRHLASTEYPPPEGHSLEINAVGACGSDLWQKIRDRWRAGRRTTWRWDARARGQKGSAKGANRNTDAKLQDAVLTTLCVLSHQVREVRGAVFMCWMIKQEAPEYKKPKEQLRACSELAATKGKGHGLGPPGIAAFTGLLQALSERGSTVVAANAAGVANLKQTRGTIWNRRGLSIWYLNASWPKCTTKL